MAESARKPEPDEHDITPPFLKGLDGGSESDSRRASLTDVSKKESNPETPTTGSVAEREAKGSNVVQGPWKNNVTDVASAIKPGGMVASLKKRSPMLAILMVLVTLGTGIGLFGGSALLPMSIVSNLVQKFNTQETSMTIRTNKLIASKMSGDVTTGTCNIIKIACRYTRPSNRFLTQLEGNGIKAIDKNGEAISKSGIFPNTRPVAYEYTNSEGKTISVEAKDLYKTLVNDAEFRDAFHSASKTRFMSLTDYVFNTVKTRFGFSTSDKLKSATDEKSLASEVEDVATVDDNGAKAAAKAGGAEAEAAGEKALEDTADKEVQQLANDGKGNALGLVAGTICLGTDAPGLIVKANRAYEMAKLIKYSVVFLSAFGAIKAGDATPAEVGAIGGMLTTVVNGKSAMDSFGMRYVMDGDTKPQNNNYQKFSPGASIISKLGGFAAISNSRAKISTCNVATNPVTGAAIDEALATSAVGTLGTTALAALANVAIGTVLGHLAEVILPSAIKLVVSNLPMTSILNSVFGDLTKDLSGEPVGDALVSGASHVMGQTANAGGNMPLTPSQAVAYDDTTKQVQIAYAQEDRATKSPLDASSPNTFLGSIIQKLIPYYTDSSSTAGSVSSTFATIGKMVMGSFGLALQPLAVSAASDDSSQYKLCDDPEIKNNDIAAGPFCNIIYGIPTQYLDKDPVTIVKDLMSPDPTDPANGGNGKYPGNVDVNTGDPVPGSELAKWIELCTDGTTDQANNCKIKDGRTADFALYTIDHRIQKSMDDDETTTTTTTPDTTTTPSSGDAQQLAKEILANNKISYISAADTTAHVSPKEDIEDAAAGKVGSAGVMTSTEVLRLIATVGQTHSVSISAIQSGGQGHCGGQSKSSCPNDPHYTGDAVDFDILDGTPLKGRDKGSLEIIKIAEGIWPTGSAFGQKQCGSTPTLPSGWTTFDDTCNHIHLDVPAGTP
jgi:hypothetical protein